MKPSHLDILHQELEELIKNAEEFKKREKENLEKLEKLKKEHAEKLKKLKKENPKELKKRKKEHTEELSKLKKEQTKELSKLVVQVTSFEGKVLKRFNYSVLSGEYYAKDASLILEKIKEAILLMDFERFINYVEGNFSEVLNDFRVLIKYTKVKNNNKAFPVSEYDVSHLLNYKTDDFTIKQFKINVLLAKLDHDYHSSEEIERKLNRISSYLKRQIKPTHYNNIYDVLKDKVNFLLFKIKRRRDRNTVKPENKYYNSFIEELESIDDETLTVTKKDYHYYHKKSKNYRKEKKEVAISELIIDFQRGKNPKEDDDVFQKLAYQHMDIFLETQEFRTSLSIYEDSLNIEVKINKIKQNFLKIKKEFDELVNSSEKRYHYRFIKEYVLTIDKTFELLLDKFNTRQYAIEEEEEDIDFIRSLTKTLSKSRVIYAKYYKNFIKKKNIHLYLPFEECRHNVRVGKESINLFIDSSYVLPLNYKEDKIIFNSLVKKIEDKISTIYFNTSALYIKAIIKADDVKKAQFNNIQVIAVFAGLITFITSSSVAFMSKDVKITSIAFILLTLIIAFTIFSLSLKILFESSKKWIYIFFVILSIFLSLHYFHYTNIKQTKTNKGKGSLKDSIKEEAYIRIPSKVTISLEE